MAERWSDDVDPLSRVQKRIPLGVSAGQSDRRIATYCITKSREMEGDPGIILVI